MTVSRTGYVLDPQDFRIEKSKGYGISIRAMADGIERALCTGRDIVSKKLQLASVLIGSYHDSIDLTMQVENVISEAGKPSVVQLHRAEKEILSMHGKVLALPEVFFRCGRRSHCLRVKLDGAMGRIDNAASRLGRILTRVRRNLRRVPGTLSLAKQVQITGKNIRVLRGLIASLPKETFLCPHGTY